MRLLLYTRYIHVARRIAATLACCANQLSCRFVYIFNGLVAIENSGTSLYRGNSEEWCMDAPFTELRMQLI